MIKLTTFAAAASIALLSSAAFAAPCATGTTVSPNKDASKSSSVDPSATGNSSPGAKAESPGTVGAMNKAGSAVGTATSPADVNAQDKGKPTAAQAANGDC